MNSLAVKPLLLLSLILLSGYGFAEQKKVLFIGNSYTYAHDMPEIISQMAISTNDQLSYQMHAPGGATAAQHAANTTLTALINSTNWDWVTIQTQSLESALSQTYFETQVYPHIITLVSRIRSHNPNSIPLFFMTWGRQNGAADWCDELPYMCTFEGMNNKLRERYLYYAESTASAVNPAAVLWQQMRLDHPTVNLYEGDGSHPSRIGVYLNACGFYSMIFNKDPSLITYNDPYIDDSLETQIKQLVKQQVFLQPQKWNFVENIFQDSFEDN